MKRKDVEEFYDDFSSIYLSNPSRKSRRLDAELVRVADEYPNVNATHVLNRGLSQEQPWTSSVMVHADAASIDTMRTSNASEERALVLYDPTKTAFVKSLSSPEFSIVVESDLIPGLKDCLLTWGSEKFRKSVDDEMRKERSSEGSKDSLAVVPWVAFRSPMVCEERVSVADQPSEAEGEMMDMDEPYVNKSIEKDVGIGQKVEVVGGFSTCQQRHYTMLNLLQNTPTSMNRL